MLTVNISDLRINLKKYLSAVGTGGSVHIVSHGKEIARLVPPAPHSRDAKKRMRDLRRHCIIGDVISPLEESWNALSDRP